MKVTLAPNSEKFVIPKVKTGESLDAREVVLEGLRGRKEQEEIGEMSPSWLEQAIQEGLDSPDLPVGPEFWRNLRGELHREHKNGSRRR